MSFRVNDTWKIRIDEGESLKQALHNPSLHRMGFLLCFPLTSPSYRQPWLLEAAHGLVQKSSLSVAMNEFRIRNPAETVSCVRPEI